MKNYRVYAKETVFYAFNIEANSEDEAMKKAYEADFTNLEPSDYCDFEVIEAEKLDY